MLFDYQCSKWLQECNCARGVRESTGGIGHTIVKVIQNETKI